MNIGSVNPRYLLIVILPVVFCIRPTRTVGQDRSVSVTLSRSHNSYLAVAHNQHAYSVTVTLSVSGKNFKTSSKTPQVTVVAPHSENEMLHIYQADSTKSYKFDTNYSWFMGNVYAHHDDSYIYRLPLSSGKSSRVGQGFGGAFTHSGLVKYAIDFVMEEGTPVYAARGGWVAQIREDSDVGGNSPKYKDDANFILIEHNDGTFAEYAHLRKSGALVKTGDTIERGQLIGYSGNTGYTSGPHLHFMVVKVLHDGSFQSLPVRFYTQRGVVRDLVEGETYTAK